MTRVRRAGYATVLAGACVVLLELLVRVFHLVPTLTERPDWVADPLIPYKYRPLSTQQIPTEPGEQPIEYRHNSLGFRDEEHVRPKPPGVFRIVALGDSFTYGVGVEFEDSYLVRLERMLNARPGPRVEIIKLGIPRYFPAAERLVLEHYGLPFEPDLVLVAVLPNDALDTRFGLDAVVVDSGFLISRRAKELGPLAIWLYRHSHVMRILLRYGTQIDPSVRAEDIWKENGIYEDAWQAMELDLQGIGKMAQEHGARFAVVNIAQSSLWGPTSTYTDERLARWARQQDVTFISTLAALRAASEHARLYWEVDGHCRAAGYEVIATTLFDALANTIP
jgi:lysophospholipase L1-like esterase